jgi:hypothetical protein
MLRREVPILMTLIMEALHSSKTSFSEELHGITSQKTTFFIVTAVKNVKSYMALYRRGNVPPPPCGTNWVFISQKTAFFIVKCGGVLEYLRRNPARFVRGD